MQSRISACNQVGSALPGRLLTAGPLRLFPLFSAFPFFLFCCCRPGRFVVMLGQLATRCDSPLASPWHEAYLGFAI